MTGDLRFPVYLADDLTDPATGVSMWGVLVVGPDTASFRVDPAVHNRWSRRSRTAQWVLGTLSHWLVTSALVRGDDEPAAWVAKLAGESHESSGWLGTEPVPFEQAESCTRLMWRTGRGPRPDLAG